jgi:outer membrane protein OmpA-like peptidoglycan-associated protein
MAITTAILLGITVPGVATQLQKDKQPISADTNNVVVRTAKSIDFHQQADPTKIDFYGTILLPASRGEATVESRRTFTEIKVELRNLQSATLFGPEYLTYILWAITPEGNAANLGEVILNGKTGKLEATTELRAFGLVVTAEPYFSVTKPSDAVVLESDISDDAKSKGVGVDAKYELLPRGHYSANASPADRIPIVRDKKIPLGLYEARNAVRIALWAGADVYATDTFQKASDLLAQAEKSTTIHAGSGTAGGIAREAVETADQARLNSVKNQSEARLARERQDAANRAAEFTVAVGKAMIEAGNVERRRQDAQKQSDRIRFDARAQSDRARLDAEDSERHAASDKQNALVVKIAAAKAERDRQELRRTLLNQLNAVLHTEDGARGLIVNMSDVGFDTGQYRLNSEACEKLSQISAIVLAYPALKFEIEGYTDNVGTEHSNMVLSENRANSVRDFLLKQGIAASAIVASGFGEEGPVAPNDTATGRRQNRRVQLIISGDIIGTNSTIEPKPIR